MRVHLLASLLLSACASRSPATPPTPTATTQLDAAAAWAELTRTLPGTWTLVSDSGDTLEVGYRVVSHGSALLETYGADPAAQTLSVYHPDGRSLMLTHYCAQGNQVRLRVSAVAPGRVAFSHVDATNVDPRQSVMHELVFVLGADTLERTEVYVSDDGARHTGVQRFVRKPA